MIGKVRSIIAFKPKVRRINFEVEGIVAKTYVDEGNANAGKWDEVKVGDFVKDLEWYDEEQKIITADSPIVVLK